MKGNLSLFKRRADDDTHILIEFGGPDGNVAACGVKAFNVNYLAGPMSSVTCPSCPKAWEEL